MEEYNRKFSEDYSTGFARQINDIHLMYREVFAVEISDGDRIIDLGGGPGIGARLIDDLGISAAVLNVEPSESINDLPELKDVEYFPEKMTFEAAFSFHFPWKADRLLLLSSAHEIALGYGGEAKENKRLFAEDLRRFAKRFLNDNSKIILGFPGYKQGVTQEQIEKQRAYNDRLLGHSHSYDEYVYLEDFAAAFPGGPVMMKTGVMVLADQEARESVLTATVAVYDFSSKRPQAASRH